jgi:2-methylcitrate dehydratase PrpD
VRNLWVGAANSAGLAAARLAAAGVAVADSTADFTFGEILGEFDPEPLAVRFSERFEILGGYFKRHAACAYTHPPIDALLAMREEGPVDADQIEGVTVETYAIAAALDRPEVPTRLAAMFSIPYVVAVTLLDGAFGPDATSRERRHDPSVRDLAGRIDVRATEEFESRLPEKRGARVTVRMRDGSERSAEVEQPVGDAAHEPLGWDGIRSKLGGLIGVDRTERLETLLRSLPDEPVDILIEELTRS